MSIFKNPAANHDHDGSISPVAFFRSLQGNQYILPWESVPVANGVSL